MINRITLNITTGLSAFLLSFAVFAETSIFGLTLGKTTESELKEQYPSVEHIGFNSWTGGEIFKIPTSDVNFEGIKKLNVLLNDNKNVTAVFITLNNSRFDFVNSSLAKKYRLIKKQVPTIGNKYVHYTNSDDVITLDAPHLSFEMQLYYMQKSTRTMMDKKMEQKNSDQKKVEASQL